MPRRALRRERVPLAIAAAVYVVTAIAVTWPLVLHLGSALYLSPHRPYGDYTGTLANLQSLLDGPHIPFLPGHISQLNAPNGLSVDWGLNLVILPESSLLFVLGLLFGSVAAVSLFELIGFVASGLAMFGLTRWVTRNAWVALLSGWAFAFYPYAVANGEHPDFIHGWPLVLMLWAGLRALERPTVRRGLLAGGGAVLALAWTPYYLLLAGMAFAAEVVAALVVGWRRRQLPAHVRCFGVASAIVAGYIVLVLAIAAVDPAAGTHPSNSLNDVIAQSARPANYYLAPSWNGLLGRVTGSELVQRGWDSTEKTLYVGLSLVALALVAVAMALRRRLTPGQTRAVIVAATVGVVAALCSGPPQVRIAGHLVNMPSWYLFHLTNGFRIYTRFVIVVELALCVLAGIGLASLLARRSGRLRAIVFAGVGVIVALDLWGPIPSHFERLRVPGIYARLAKLPPGTYADYPLGPADQRPDYHDLFYQHYAGHPAVNGYPAGSVYAGRDQALADLSVPDVGSQLAALGVRYVLVERHPLPPFVEPPPPGPGFVELASDSYAVLYRNDSAVVTPIDPSSGFSDQEGDPHASFRWIDAPTAVLRIQADCSVCNGVLTFGSSSFARPRLLTVRDAATGRVLARTTVGMSATITVRLHFSRTTTISLTTAPGPQSIAQTTGSQDQRHVSVNVQAPQFRLDGQKVGGTW